MKIIKNETKKVHVRTVDRGQVVSAGIHVAIVVGNETEAHLTRVLSLNDLREVEWDDTAVVDVHPKAELHLDP